MHPDVLKFWIDIHQGEGIKYLTGGSMFSTTKCLGVNHLIRSGLHVMEIGIGTGRCVRELAALGCNVTAVDICWEALEKVSGHATCYTSLDHVEQDSIELAISLHLLQHMDTPIARKHLADVIHVIGADGLYALETPWIEGNPKNDCENYSLEDQMHGGCCRTPEMIVRLARDVGAIADGPVRTRTINNVTLGAMHIRCQ
jgi:uncharacterized UPF0146 family protein